MKPAYSASLSRGRKSWCVTFRHPLIPDPAGKLGGKRVRYGLGTDVDETAKQIVSDLNAILANQDLWKPGARERALVDYHTTAVECFYDGIQTKPWDSWEKREEILPLPTANDGYSTALLTGGTGVGKTTVLRQIIGTDPESERFPATSKNRTTTFETEIICAPGNFHAVVTFLTPERARSYIEECIEAAVMGAAEGLAQKSVARRFLVHSEGKFRLSYLVGKFVNSAATGEDLEDEEDDERGDVPVSELSTEEQTTNETRVAEWVARSSALGAKITKDLESELGESAEELTGHHKDAFLQLVAGKLRDDDDMQALVDEVFEAVETRFQFVEAGEYDSDNSGWPLCWQFHTSERSEFIKHVSRFASNHAPLFGRLLAPLVDGMRVQGPFCPDGWSESNGVPPIVLLDGVGLGHLRGTSVQIPTTVTRRFDIAHAIVLVDDATRPMLDAAQSLLRTVTASGHERKLTVVFTHFDQMKSDNFEGRKDKEDSVFAAVEQAIQGVDEALDNQSGAGRRLRSALTDRVFFVGHIQKALKGRTEATRRELNGLLEILRSAHQPLVVADATPCYNMADLVVRIWPATAQFQKHWNSVLSAEHWKRIQALSRRFANQWSDHYDTLQPVAHMRALFVEKLALFIATPREWKPTNATSEAKDEALARLRREFSSRIEAFVAKRFREEHLNEWNVAYARKGPGSGRARARDVRSINEEVAPVPDEMPPQLVAQLLDDLQALFREAVDAAGARIVAS